MSPSRAAFRLIPVLLLSLGGCVAAGHTSSPWEWGGGVRVAPGLWSVGDGDVTLHPAAGYTYLSFDGGHDGLWEVGGQVRKSVDTGTRSIWFGGEATFSHLRTTFDYGEGSVTSSTNGYSFTALIGTPVGDSRWGPNIFAGAGISDYGSQGWNVRVGLDFQPSFLWSQE